MEGARAPIDGTNRHFRALNDPLSLPFGGQERRVEGGFEEIEGRFQGLIAALMEILPEESRHLRPDVWLFSERMWSDLADFEPEFHVRWIKMSFFIRTF